MLVCVPKEEQKHTFSDSLLIPATQKLTPTQIIPPLPKRMKCSVCPGDETRHWVLAPQTSRLTVVTGSRAQIVQNMDYYGRGEQESRSEWRERTFWSRRPSVAGVSWDTQWALERGMGCTQSTLAEFGSNREVGTGPRPKGVRTWPRSVAGGTLSPPELNYALLWASGSQAGNRGNAQAFGERDGVM